jgi:hypothetical protein
VYASPCSFTRKNGFCPSKGGRCATPERVQDKARCANPLPFAKGLALCGTPPLQLAKAELPTLCRAQVSHYIMEKDLFTSTHHMTNKVEREPTFSIPAVRLQHTHGQPVPYLFVKSMVTRTGKKAKRPSANLSCTTKGCSPPIEPSFFCYDLSRYHLRYPLEQTQHSPSFQVQHFPPVRLPSSKAANKRSSFATGK